MADEFWDTLMRFHREVALPDLVGATSLFQEEMAAFRGEVNAHFDKIFKLLDRVDLEKRITELETEI